MTSALYRPPYRTPPTDPILGRSALNRIAIFYSEPQASFRQGRTTRLQDALNRPPVKGSRPEVEGRELEKDATSLVVHKN